MKVLCVTYGGGHIAMMLPVIRALRAQRPEVHIDFLTLTTAKLVAVTAGEKALGFIDLMHLVDVHFVSEWGTRLSVGNVHPAVDPAETAAYIGINFWDLTQQQGLEGAREVYAREGRHGFYPINFFRRVIAHFRPDVVVSTNSPRSEQAALDAAMEQGIATLSMIDLFAMSFDPYLKRARHADRITVMLPQVTENLVAAGIERSRIIETGNPAFDSLFDPLQREAAQRLRQSLGWEGLKVVLWAGIVERLPSAREGIAAGTAYGQSVEAILRRWCARRSDVALIIRYHPNEAQLFPNPGPQARVHVSRPFLDPLHPQILAAQAVVVTGSTVGVETACAGVPVLSLESSGSSGVMSYEQLGMSQGVPSLADLESCLDRMLAGPGLARTQMQAGPAAPRIAEEILLLAG